MPRKEEEEEELVLHFSALLCPSCPNKNRTKFFTFDETDLVDGGDVRISAYDAAFPHEGRLCFHFPFLPGYCHVGRTLFIVGGAHDMCISSGDVLSFDPAAPSAPPPPDPPGDCHPPGLCYWDVAAVMSHERQSCLAIPYEGKIFIFGGVRGPNPFPEIYDPQSGNFLPAPKGIPQELGPVYPNSYFHWKDSRNPHKKPLIMLYCHYPSSQLYLYDVEGDRCELFDPDFPSPLGDSYLWGRNLIPLDCSDTLLLIIDYAAHWSIYDLSAKKLSGEVHVKGLKKNWQVTHAFWRRSSEEGSLIFYIFMDDVEGEYQTYCRCVPYAKVRLQTHGQEVFATLESEGALEVDEHVYLCMFAEQTSKTKMTTMKEAGFRDGEHSKKKMKL